MRVTTHGMVSRRREWKAHDKRPRGQKNPINLSSAEKSGENRISLQSQRLNNYGSPASVRMETSMNDLLTIAECCEYLGVSKSKLTQLRKDGAGPLYIKFGRSIRYRLSSIKRWLLDQETNASGQGE